jgi:3-oxoacyl-[acyl-carrier protein] reductase
MNNIDSFKGLRILVTGGSGGIGRSTVNELLSRGARVGIGYNKNRPDYWDENDNFKTNACLLKADLRSKRETEELFEEFIKWAGGIDGLVNNAGDLLVRKHFMDLDENNIDADISLNLKAPFWLSRLAIKHMENNNIKGAIVNITSISAKFGGSYHTVFYGLSKSALELMTFSLSRYCAPLGIRINALRLGVFDTNFHKRHVKDLSERIQMIPAKRMGDPNEAAQWILNLLNSQSAYMNGQIVSLTGGE